jgi:RluA family pseudouridine synthase
MAFLGELHYLVLKVIFREKTMAKPNQIDLGGGVAVSILYEDSAILAIDKPANWMLAPESWDRTGRKLHLAMLTQIQEGAYWARSRNLTFLRFIHRLDAETTGVLLLAKSAGGLREFSRLFESGQTQKKYLAVVSDFPKQESWTCDLNIAEEPGQPGRMRVSKTLGKEASTHFRILQTHEHGALIEATPATGRTHQIRLHLTASGCPVVGDCLYGHTDSPDRAWPLALRAWRIALPDPFRKRQLRIQSDPSEFLKTFGFKPLSGSAI